jgi:hypothetical protein
LQLKHQYHGQVGKTFSIQFKSVGHPEVHYLVRPLPGEINAHFNKTETFGPVDVDIGDKIVQMDGTILELDFGKISHRFSTRYLLIAENSMGKVNHTFCVQGHGKKSSCYMNPLCQGFFFFIIVIFTNLLLLLLF